MLVNALVGAEREHVLVLDDYHVISEPAIHGGVKFLLEHLPVASHLVIATRREPPVDISRLRARGELGEIASEQLRFDDAEASALLNDTLELALGADELHLLTTRTEGWAAGLLGDRPRRDHRPAGQDQRERLPAVSSPCARADQSTPPAE